MGQHYHLKLKKGHNILLISFSIIFSLLILEGLTRIIVPQDLSGTWKIYSQYGYLINKSSCEVRHQFSNRVVHYHFNKNHLRGEPINNKLKKVLVLGDSFTFGILLNNNDTYVHQLQLFCNRDIGGNIFQFLNGGSGGWGTSDYVLFTEDFGEQINPAIIIVFLNTDDIGRSIKDNYFNIKDKSTLQLIRRPYVKHFDYYFRNIIQSSTLYQWFAEHSHLFQLTRKCFSRQYHKLSTAEQYPLPTSNDVRVDPKHSQLLGQALFRRLKKWCDRHHVKLLVLTTGTPGHPLFLQLENNPTAQFMKKAEEIFSQEKIEYHDITKELMVKNKGKYQEYMIPYDGHPNVAGAQLIARCSWEWLRPIFINISRTASKGDSSIINQNTK